MKKILVILGFSCFALVADAQRVLDANRNLKGFIERDGTLQDKNQAVLYTINPNGDGKIFDAKNRLAGFLINEHEMQDKEHKTVAFIMPNGNIENAKHERIGRIDASTGPVTDARNNIIGYIERTEPMWAACYFFLFKL